MAWREADDYVGIYDLRYHEAIPFSFYMRFLVIRINENTLSNAIALVNDELYYEVQQLVYLLATTSAFRPPSTFRA